MDNYTYCDCEKIHNLKKKQVKIFDHFLNPPNELIILTYLNPPPCNKIHETYNSASS